MMGSTPNKRDLFFFFFFYIWITRFVSQGISAALQYFIIMLFYHTFDLL